MSYVCFFTHLKAYSCLLLLSYSTMNTMYKVYPVFSNKPMVSCYLWLWVQRMMFKWSYAGSGTFVKVNATMNSSISVWVLRLRHQSKTQVCVTWFFIYICLSDCIHGKSPPNCTSRFWCSRSCQGSPSLRASLERRMRSRVPGPQGKGVGSLFICCLLSRAHSDVLLKMCPGVSSGSPSSHQTGGGCA